MEKIERVIRFNIEQRKKGLSVLHPCLIARSGSGKSATIYRLSKSLQYPVHTLLLQTMLEYEICGIPSVDKKKGIVKFYPAEWIKRASEKPYLIFIDEIDKPRADVISAILSLLTSFRIGEVELHSESVFILAGQDAPNIDDLTSEAFRRRMIIIPIHWWYDEDYFSRNFHINLSWYSYVNNVEVQKIYPSPREIEYLLSLWKSGIFNELQYRELLNANYEKDFVEQFIQTLKSEPSLNASLFIKLINENPERLKNLDINGLFILAQNVDKINAITYACLIPWLAVISIDERKRFLELQYETVSATETFLTDENIDYACDVIVRAGEIIAEYLLEKNKVSKEELIQGKQLQKLLSSEDVPILIDRILKEFKNEGR